MTRVVGAGKGMWRGAIKISPSRDRSLDIFRTMKSPLLCISDVSFSRARVLASWPSAVLGSACGLLVGVTDVTGPRVFLQGCDLCGNAIEQTEMLVALCVSLANL